MLTFEIALTTPQSPPPRATARVAPTMTRLAAYGGDQYSPEASYRIMVGATLAVALGRGRAAEQGKGDRHVNI